MPADLLCVHWGEFSYDLCLFLSAFGWADFVVILTEWVQGPVVRGEGGLECMFIGMCSLFCFEISDKTRINTYFAFLFCKRKIK